MMGRRVLPLVVGLWACSALGQPFTASQTIAIDAGSGSYTRAFVATSGVAQYAMVNAGLAIQVFDTTGTQLPPLSGTFASFAVANNVTISSTATTTVVAVADVAAPACSSGMCLRIFFWDPVNNFQLQSSYTPLGVVPNVMAIDTVANPFEVYFATPGLSLYEQSLNISPTTGTVTIGFPNSRFLPPGAATVAGMAADDPDQVLFLSDTASNLFTVPLDVTNLDGGLFAAPTAPPTTYGDLLGLSFYENPTTSSLVLLGGGAVFGVYELAPDAGAAIIQEFQIFRADAGPALPSGVSFTTPTFMVVTEDDTGGGAWLNLVDGGPVDAGPSDAGSDAGLTDAGTATDANFPVIPTAPPGPGALPMNTNSCNCSSAGSAPVLLVLLLPLLVPRRRR